MRRVPSRSPKIGRPSVTSLPLPSRRYDLTLTPGFETVQQINAEDQRRAGMLRRRAASVGGDSARALAALADAIDPDVTRQPTSPASARFMRQQRRLIIGNLWAMLDER